MFLVARIGSYDLVACLRHVGQGHLTCIPGSRYPCHVLRPALVEPRWTFLGKARFIAWHLRHHLIMECRWGPRHFGEFRLCLDYDPGPGPIKTALCTLGGALNKYQQMTKQIQSTKTEPHRMQSCFIPSVPFFFLVVLLDCRECSWCIIVLAGELTDLQNHKKKWIS